MIIVSLNNDGNIPSLFWVKSGGMVNVGVCVADGIGVTLGVKDGLGSGAGVRVSMTMSPSML